MGKIIMSCEPTIYEPLIVPIQLIVFPNEILLPFGHVVLGWKTKPFRPDWKTDDSLPNALVELIPHVDLRDLLLRKHIGWIDGIALQDIRDCAIFFVVRGRQLNVQRLVCVLWISNAENDNPFANLRDAEMMRAYDERFWRESVAERAQVVRDRAPCIAVVMGDEIANIFKDDIPSMVMAEDSFDVKEKSALCLVAESELLPRLREGLTRESCTENIVCRDVALINLFDVAERCDSIIGFVGSFAVFVPFGCEDAPTAKLLHRKVKSSDAGEKIDETELSVLRSRKRNLKQFRE